MGLPCLSLHMFIYLFPDIIHDGSSITTDNFPLFFFCAIDLSKIPINQFHNEVGIIIGKFTDGIQKHTCQSIYCVIDFEDLSIYRSKKLLIYRIKSFNFCCCNLKIFYQPFHRERLERNSGTCLDQYLRNRNGFSKDLGLFDEVFFTERLLFATFGRRFFLRGSRWFRLVKQRCLFRIYCLFLCFMDLSAIDFQICSIKAFLRFRIVKSRERLNTGICNCLVKKADLPVIYYTTYINSVGRFNCRFIKITIAENIAVFNFIDQFTVMIVSNNIESINVFITCSLAKRQAKSTSNCLHGEDITLGRIQRDNRKKIINIPPLFQFIDMKNNFGGIVVFFNREKATDIFLCFFTLHIGVNLNNLSFISSVFKSVAVNHLTNLFCMIRIFACYENNWFDIIQIILITIFLENCLAVFMKSQSITDFHLFNVVCAVTCHIGSSHHNRSLQISFNCTTGKIIGIDYITGCFGRCSKF